jgi:hydroxymethylbilane synthase
MAERTLEESGANKGLFTKEIDEALMSGFIDLAVHSAKDMATVLPSPLVLAGCLVREDPRDALLSSSHARLDELPQGATVGTASLRRAVQIKAHRRDLKTVPLRGNVDTRLKKIASGVADATVLAVAGLKRLGLENRLTNILDTDVMLPSVGQGALGIVARDDRKDILSLIATVNHDPTLLCVRAERAFLRVLDGSCKTPIAGLAQLASDEIMILEGLVATPDGSKIIRKRLSGSASDPEKIGEELGAQIKGELPDGFFDCRA